MVRSRAAHEGLTEQPAKRRGDLGDFVDRGAAAEAKAGLRNWTVVPERCVVELAADRLGVRTVMMDGMGGGMWGMGLIGLLVLLVLILAVIALVKYIGGGRR